MRVREIGPERRTLEQVVFDVTGHGSDRVSYDGEPMIYDVSDGVAR